MSYQKVYMNQVHSSSLLCQLAQMWKSQLLCDAIIKTGTVTTKAHRLVLVAACPMLQSMENASVGDHLEVRLAAEIKQDSVNTFLQYLYEGFMMLTEENVRDVEKVARLLQVESIVTCCSDFDKCMRSKMGMLPPGANYKYNFHDQVEFRHVRTTDLQKTVQERMMKRAAEMSRPSSPGHKRQRMHRPSSPPVDVSSLSDHRFSSDRISHVGSTGGPSSRSGYVDHSSMPGVVEIAEDTLELVHTEAPDGGTGPGRGHDQPVVKKSVSVSVASQINRNRELKVVNVTGDCETRTSSKPSPASGPTSRGAITVSPLTIPVDSSSLSRESSSFSKTPDSANQSNVEIPDFSQSESFMFSTPHSDSSSQRSPFPVSLSQASMSSSHGPKQFSSPSQGSSKMSKPFAAGSAMQSGYSSSQSYSQSPSNRQQPQQRPEKNESIDRPSSASSDGKQSLSGNIKSDQSESGSADMTPDLSIVKVEAGQRNQVEPSDTGGLDMYVDMHGQGVMHMQRQEDDEDAGETSDIEYEEPSGEWSNEGSNLSADQSASWHSGSFKDTCINGNDLAMLSSSDMHIDQAIKPQHRLVATFESRCKYCICCQKLLIKTKSGWGPKTRYQCEACNVPLCKGGRTKNCFDIYHSMLFGKRYTSSSDQQSICHSTYDQQYISHSSSDQQYSNASSADHQQISDSSFDQRYFSPSVSNQQHIRKSSFD